MDWSKKQAVAAIVLPEMELQIKTDQKKKGWTLYTHQKENPPNEQCNLDYVPNTGPT